VTVLTGCVCVCVCVDSLLRLLCHETSLELQQQRAQLVNSYAYITKTVIFTGLAVHEMMQSCVCVSGCVHSRLEIIND